SRIQVAVRDAMDWMRRSMPPAAPEPAATVSDAFERALAELVNKIDTGLDSGDLLQDAKRASAALDSILSGGDLVACAHEYFRDSGERYEKSIEFRIGWNACLDAIGQARAASTATATVDDLAMLVRKLVRHVRKARPDNNMADMAMDYLRRHGLEESPLRAAAPQAGALTDSQREAIEWAIGPATSFEYTHHVAALQSLLAEQSAAPRAPIAQFAIPEGFKVVKLDPRCDGCDKGVTTGQGICCHNGCFADEERQRGRESWKQIPGFSPLPRASEQADEALKADAERYRWLLAHPEHVEYGDFYDRTYLGPSATVSDAIDAARIKEPK
ncbi:hypothetical protein HDG38_007070, partial [Paraburkholderia sp. WSM4177]|nr:hypothetical protein [Paraburkholderia sp. WSM4177]MBB5488808.1 hypothetical protein [Paraburkholderia sp. WSM4180]